MENHFGAFHKALHALDIADIRDVQHDLLAKNLFDIFPATVDQVVHNENSIGLPRHLLVSSEPMKPAPPVTNTVLLPIFISIFGNVTFTPM